MRGLTALSILLVVGCDGEPNPEPLEYSDTCKHDLPSSIRDTTGSFVVDGPAGTPNRWGVGTSVTGTGSLIVVACDPSLADDILDDLVLDLTLVLFDIDDQAIDLPISNEAVSTNLVTGGVTDWGDVVDWDGPEGTFLTFTEGSSSWSEVDKDGRLTGVAQVTATDPAGSPMTITMDLSW